MGFFKYYPIYVLGGYYNDFYERPFVNSFEFFSLSTTFCQNKGELVIIIIIIIIIIIQFMRRFPKFETTLKQKT